MKYLVRMHSLGMLILLIFVSNKNILETAMDLMNVNKILEPDQSTAFVDLQGFRMQYNNFVVKEFTLYDGYEQFHAIVQASCSFKRLSGHYKRHADLATERIHGIPFASGDYSFVEFLELAAPKLAGKRIYVESDEKEKWFRHVFKDCAEINCNCSNMTDLGFAAPLLKNKKIYDICSFHNLKFGWTPHNCTLANVLKMKDVMCKE